MRKTKKALMMIMASLALVSISACGKAANTETKTEESTAVEETATASEVKLEKPESYGKVTLGKYKGIELSVDSEDSIKVSDEDVENELKSMLETSTKYEDITGRAAAMGDVANIDFEGKKDGVAFEGGSSQGFDLELGSNSFIPGFEEGVVGMNIGDKKDIPLTFPKDYSAEELAGKDVVFTVTLNALKSKIEAKLTDEWVAEYTGDKYKTVAEFKTAIKEDLEKERRYQKERMEEEDALQLLIADSKIEPNPEAVEYEKSLQVEMFNNTAAMYNMEPEALMQMYGRTKEQFEEDFKNAALDIVKVKLVKEELIKQAKIKVTDADYEYVVEYRGGGATLEELKTQYGEDAVEEAAMDRAVLNYLVSNATKTERNYDQLETDAVETQETTAN